MTKEEFMKQVLGAQFTENEMRKGLLDPDMVMRKAKDKYGAQYSENEMKGLMDMPLKQTQAETSDTPWREETDNLVKTQFESQFGYPIYENEFGTKMSEKSTTIPFGGQFLNFRTIIDGKKLDDRGVMNMFLNGQLEPTSVHKTLEEAIESAKIRSEGIKHMLPKGTYARDNEGDMYTGENTPSKNLGIGDQASTNNKYYDDILDIYLPMNYQRMGGTGDERFRQGTDGFGFDDYGHGADRNYFNNIMMNTRYNPLNFS